MAAQRFKLTSFGNVAGLVLGVAGAVYGYFQAAMSDFTPVQGAIALGLAGLIIGRAFGTVIKSILQLTLVVIAIAVVAYFFRDQLEVWLGFDPFAWVQEYFGDYLPREG